MHLLQAVIAGEKRARDLVRDGQEGIDQCFRSKASLRAYRRSLASFAVLLFATAFVRVSASAQSNGADLAISALAATPELPGASFTYHVFVSNLGPNGSQGPAVITGTLPAGVTPTHCVAGWGGPFQDIPGTCVIVGQSVTGTVPQSLVSSAQDYFLDLDATLTPSAPNGGAAYSANFSVSGASADPNPANNSTTAVITTPAPLSITVSAKQLDFGVVALNHNSSSLTISVANAGKSAFMYRTPAFSGDFVAIDDSCTGFPRGGISTEVLVTPGITCVATVVFAPASLGPASGSITFSERDNVGQSAQQVVQLSGVGSTLALQPSTVIFRQPQADGTSASVGITLINVASTPVPIGEIQTSSSFFQTNDCAGVAQPKSTCNISVSFTPTVVGSISGTLTVPVQAPGSPLVATLQGTGSAVKLTPSPIQRPTFDFGTQDLGTPSDPIPIMLTNVSIQPITINSISATGIGFHEKDDCPHRLHPGESCTIAATFNPKLDGPGVGSLVIDPKDPIGPQTFRLTGSGAGILHNVVLLHYDYLEAADHTHDPEVVAPGAIQEVVKAFARHGITLIVDPRHTAIPESAPSPTSFPTIVFGAGNCGGAPGFVNFYDLKAAYYQPKHKRTHYAIFGHAIADASSCEVNVFSGLAELPGQNFVFGMDVLVFQGTPASLQSFIVAGAFMHELGHNLGLHHGGGFGPFGDDTNFKPNYLSVMNYNNVFSGIPQADAIGSMNLRSCDRDRDCGDGGSCVNGGTTDLPANVCVRLDYSRQLLPTGGNTPGALDEADLNEAAGLGSGTPDMFNFTDGQCNFQLASSDGPADWDGDGSPTNQHASVDLLAEFSGACPTAFRLTLPGFNDWEALTSKLDATEAVNEANSGAPLPVAVEKNLETIRQKHLLYPPRPAEIVARPGCGLPSAPIAPGQPGTLTITIPGTGSLDAREVDPSSLTLHGLKPLSTTIVDANGDGHPDLVLTFDTAQLHLSPQEKEVRLSGWLKNSQRFVANASVTIVNGMSTQPASCRN